MKRIRTRRRWFPLLLVGILTAGCNDDPTRASGDVQGTWEVEEESGAEVYLRVEGDRIEEFIQDTIADCFDLRVFDILEVDGVRHRITTGADTFTIELRRDDDALVVTAFGQADRYVRSSVNTAALSVCELPAPTGDCALLPRLHAGILMDELTLDAADPVNDDGSHYELYALWPDSPIDVQVDMRSTDLDSYLLLYDSAGTFLEFNDDVDNLTPNARLTPSLDAACYILMATSRFADEFGSYEIEVTQR